MATSPVARPSGLVTFEWLKSDTGSAHVRDADAYDPVENVVKMAMLSWDTGTLAWVKFTGAGGGGGGGGAATIADGADVAQGARGDTAWDGSAASATGISIWKATLLKLEAIRLQLAGSIAVSGTFWQPTQPVSLATNTPDVTDRAARLLGHVTVDAAPSTAVTNANLDAALSTLNSQATQLLVKAKTDNLDTPLSGIKTGTDRIPAQGQALAAASTPVVLPAAQITTLTPPPAITGFALDATLTGGTAKSIARAGAKGATAAADVTSTAEGADHQAVDVQLYHGGVAKDPTAIRALTNADIVKAQLQDNAGTAITVGQKTMAASVPVAIASDQSAVPVSNANLDVALSTRLKPADTLAGVTTVAAVTAITNALPTGTNKLGTVDIATAPATAKGVQGANGVPTQELRDAGRNTRIFMLDTITAAPVAEALATVVQWYGNAAVAGTTQPAVVPNGKTLRLISWKIQYQSLATVGYAVVRVRINTGGLGVLGSPLAFSFEAGSGSGATTVAMTGGVTTETGDFPEGFEIPAGAGVAFSVAGYGPTGTLTLEGGVRFMVSGYEY